MQRNCWTASGLVWVLSLGILNVITVPAWADLWKYTDDQGRTHFVNAHDQIPGQFRNTAVQVEGGVTREGAPLNVSNTANGAQPSAQGAQGAAVQNAAATPEQQAAQAAAAQGAAQGATTDEGVIDELSAQAAAAQVQSDKMAAVNPTSDQFNGLSLLPPQLKWVGDVITDPRMQKLAIHLKSPDVAKSIDSIANNPNWTYVLGAQGGLLLFLAFLGFKFRSKNPGFIASLGFKLFSFVALLVGSAGIAYVFYGEPLMVVVGAVRKAFT